MRLLLYFQTINQSRKNVNISRVFRFHVYFQFYFYILAVSSALLCVYILCNLYNLVWIICPQMGTMYRIICRYQEHTMDLNDPSGNNANNVSSNSNSALHPNMIRFKSCQNSDDEVTIPLAGEWVAIYFSSATQSI